MLNVMLVDDEERIRLGLQTMLSKYEGGVHIVGSHANGVEAMLTASGLNSGELDVLITDIDMPIMDGLRLIEQMKKKLPQVIIIVLSGFDKFDFVRQSMRLGVKDYLLKPVDKNELFQLLSQCEQFKQSTSAAPDDESEEDAEPSNGGRSKEIIIDQIKNQLKQEYNQVFDLKRLSDKIGFSPSYISKLFSRQTGETITDYLNRLRIDRALQLLDDHPALKVYEISHLIGFRDPIYFHKLFKRMVGLTPKEYKERE